MARLWRVHHPSATGPSPELLFLERQEANHVRKVLRLRVGDSIGVFDGTGNEWRGTLMTCDASRVGVRLEEPLSDVVEAPLSVSLYQGLCRPDRMEWVVQKATEVGVSAILAVTGSLSAAAASRQGDRQQRWRRIAIEACKQSGRRSLPRIEFCEDLPRVSDPRVLALALDLEGGSKPLATRCAGSRPREVWIAVGPEGGFGEVDRVSWGEQGWSAAGLGPRILRTETAGVVAAAILLHQWGDLGA